MAEVTQVRCAGCGVVYSEAAFPLHHPGGRCLPPENVGGLGYANHTWMLLAEIPVKVCCPRCGITFTQAAHDAHRDDSSPVCAAPEAMGLVLDGTLRAWRYPHE